MTSSLHAALDVNRTSQLFTCNHTRWYVQSSNFRYLSHISTYISCHVLFTIEIVGVRFAAATLRALPRSDGALLGQRPVGVAAVRVLDWRLDELVRLVEAAGRPGRVAEEDVGVFAVSDCQFRFSPSS